MVFLLLFSLRHGMFFNQKRNFKYCCFSLIRELAYQIADQFRVFGKPLGLKDCVITGGMDMMVQNSSLTQSPHIVIATPGRLADHIESGTEFFLNKIKFLV